MSRIILSGFHAEELSLLANVAKRLHGTTANRALDSVSGARLSLVITAGANDLFLGGPTVTVATIPDVKAGTGITLDATGGIWAISAADTTVRVLEGF